MWQDLVKHHLARTYPVRASGLPGTTSLANVDVRWPLLAPDHHKSHGMEGSDGLPHGRVVELGKDTMGTGFSCWTRRASGDSGSVAKALTSSSVMEWSLPLHH